MGYGPVGTVEEWIRVIYKEWNGNKSLHGIYRQELELNFEVIGCIVAIQCDEEYFVGRLIIF